MSHIIGSATGFRDFIDILDGFLTQAGHAWGPTYTGAGNGRITDWEGTEYSLAETFTITLLNDYEFSVTGSVSGALPNGLVDTEYAQHEIILTIESGSTPFETGDEFTLSTSPPWTQLRRQELVSITGTALTGSSSIWSLNDGISTGAPHIVSVSAAPPYSFEYELAAPATVVEYALYQWNSTRGPQAWEFEYFEESSESWVSLDSQSGITWSGTFGDPRVFAIASPVLADRYRVRITAINSSPMELSEIEMRTTVGGRSILEEAIVWQGPGNDGTSEILVGMHPVWRTDEDYFDLEVFGLDAWSAAAALSEQANIERDLYLPLWDDPMDYWLVANGRRCMGCVKLGTQYEFFTMGFPYNPYFPPSELNYPLGIGAPLTRVDTTAATVYAGPTPGTELRYSTTDNHHHSPTHSDRFSSQQATSWSGDGNLRIRKPDGSWLALFASAAGDLLLGPGNGVGPPHAGVIAPYDGGFGNVGISLDGDPLLWPIRLGDNVGNELGELDGIYAVSNESISAETIIRLGALDTIVFPDVNRVGNARFFAMALD